MDVTPLHYGCNTSEMHIAWQSTSPSNSIITHLLSSKMVQNVSLKVECFQDVHQIALISIIKWLLNTFLSIFLLLANILFDLKIITIDCLGHNKFNWEWNKLILSCSGWQFCGIALYKLQFLWEMYCHVHVHTLRCKANTNTNVFSY